MDALRAAGSLQCLAFFSGYVYVSSMVQTRSQTRAYSQREAPGAQTSASKHSPSPKRGRPKRSSSNRGSTKRARGSKPQDSDTMTSRNRFQSVAADESHGVPDLSDDAEIHKRILHSLRRLPEPDKELSELQVTRLVVAVVKHSKGNLDPKFQEMDEVEGLLDKEPHLSEEARRAWATQTFSDLRKLC